MNKQEKFELLYRKIVDENIFDMEKYRNEAKTQEKKNKNVGKNETLIIAVPLISFPILSICINVFLAVIGLDGKIGTAVQFWLAVICSVVFLIMLFIVLRKKKDFTAIVNYKSEFKHKVINTIIESFDKSLKYEPDKGITRDIYRKAKFNMFEKDEFETKYSNVLDLCPNIDNSYSSDDLIYGNINANCKLLMGEIYSKTTKRNGTFSVFEGLFAEIDTPKQFSEVIYIRENKKEVSFPNLKIQLDSEEFEEIFDVYASNKILAMQLLTSDVMQELLEFYNQMKILCEITITDNHIYIEFSCGKLFENPKTESFSLDKDTIYKYYRILDFTFEMSNMLVNLINDTQYE